MKNQRLLLLTLFSFFTAFIFAITLPPMVKAGSKQPIILTADLRLDLNRVELTLCNNSFVTKKDTTPFNVYLSSPSIIQRILIDIGGDADYGGTLTVSPNINGNTWNNMTDARPGISVANALTVKNQLSGISVEVINRLDGDYNPGSTGTGNGNTAGVVGDYPASATTDHALIFKNAADGRWRIAGFQAGKTYTVKFWGTRSNTTASRDAEIKRGDDIVWKNYSATNNTDYNNAAIFNITGKTEMDFDIRTKSGSDFSALNIIDISYADTGSTTPPIVNLPPFARAGADTTLQLPTDSVMLTGCNSSDPEMAVLRYKWRKISGPDTYQAPVDTLCAVKVKGLVVGTYSFELMVTDTAGLTGRDTIVITVNSLITNNWPPQSVPICHQPYKIVVVGSSTAYGTGANPIDSSWVRKFKSYLLQQNAQISVINIATPGLTSYDVSPNGTVVPYPFTVDTMRNITMALSLNPDAIILSLPSNDVARGVPTNTIHNNYNLILNAANARRVPVWVTTTQPRDGLSPAERILQMDLRDWINATYGNKAVDFWSTVANADGTINSFYGAGDGVHLNNYGHHVLFTRIVEEKIWDSICLRKNIAPVANAGPDQTLLLPADHVLLDGRNSYDPEGSIISFNWNLVSGPTGSRLLTNNMDSTSVTFTTAGMYIFRVTVTDSGGLLSTDDVIVNVLPYTTGAKRIKVNIYGGTNPFTDPQWNNWNLGSGTSSSNFLYEDASPGKINASITDAGMIVDNGVDYASTSTTCPPQVLRYNSANTSTRTLTFNGLDSTKKYGFEFYAGRTNTGNSTVFQIGNTFDTISTSSNIFDFATFHNLAPDNNEITVTLSSIGTWNYLAGFMITEQTAATPLISLATIIRSYQPLTETPGFIPGKFETWVMNFYPNPASEIIYLKLPGTLEGKYAISLSDIYGKKVWEKTSIKNTGPLTQVIHVGAFPKGMYNLQIFNKGRQMNRKLIIL